METSLVLSSILMIVQFHVCYSHDDDMGILLRHPKLYEDYVSMTTQKGIQSGLMISRVVPKESRAELCKLTLNAHFFDFENEHGSAVGQFKYIEKPLNVQHIENLYKKNIMRDLNYVEVLVNTNGQPRNYVRAILCTMEEEESVLIADEIKPDAYFVLVKKESDTRLEMVAQLQPSPILYSYSHTSNVKDDKQLLIENNFLNEYRKQGISFCRVDAYGKFRVCSAAYMAWTRSKKGTVATSNTVRVKQNDCVEKAAIHFKRANSENAVNFQNLQVDLLPCAVNVDSTKPQIFVGHDSGSNDGAYVFELEDSRQRLGKYKFSLVVRIERMNIFPEVWKGSKCWNCFLTD